MNRTVIGVIDEARAVMPSPSPTTPPAAGPVQKAVTAPAPAARPAPTQRPESTNASRSRERELSSPRPTPSPWTRHE